MQDNQSIIRPVQRPRDGWDEQFKLMAARGDDRLLDAEAARMTMPTRGRGRVRTIYLARSVVAIGNLNRKESF
jgi:hypothetical protein